MIIGLMQNKESIESLSRIWNILPFSKVIKDRSGGNLKIKKADVLEKGLVPVIDQGQDFIAGYTNEENAKVKTSLPLIVFGDHTRILKYIDFDFAMGADGTKVLEIINANPKFIYYYLQSIDIENTGYNRHFKYVKDLVFPIPPLKTQEHIASILDDAAALRDKTAQLLEEYDLLAQSIFLEMFGDPVVNPKNWKKQPLSDLGTTTTGNTPSRRNKEYYGDYIEWIKTNNINTPNMYLTQAEEYLSEKGLEKGRMVKPGAILVTCIAGSRQVIGNVSIANRKVSFNQQINAFEPKNGCSFFWYYQFILAQHYVQNHSTDGMKGIITKGKFEKINFINPPVELQNEFAEKIALIEQQKELARQELKESEDLFNCLLQKAFKGELVPESQEA